MIHWLKFPQLFQTTHFNAQMRKHRTNQHTTERWEDSEERTCQEAKHQLWINEKEKMGVIEKQKSFKLGAKLRMGRMKKVEKLKVWWMVRSEEEIKSSVNNNKKDDDDDRGKGY